MFLYTDITKMLSEAPGDEEIEDTEETEEVEEIEDTDDMSEDTEPDESDDEETEDEPMDESESETDGFDIGDEPDDETEDAEGSEVKGNPYAKKVYLKKFQYLRGLIKRLKDLIEDQKHLYINSGEDSDQNIIKVDKIKRGLNATEDQLEYLIIKGKILDLDLDTIHRLYPKFKTKIQIYMEEYGKIFKLKI